jgi:hypothetical protein
MKLNKVLMITIIAAAFVSRLDARAHYPQKVQQAVDKQGNAIVGMLNVKDKNQWHLFEKYSTACEIGGNHQYEYTDYARMVLKVKEANGSCAIYVKARQLTDDELEAIMIEDVFED